MSESASASIDVAVLGQTFCDLVFEGAPLSFAPGTETYASGLSISPGGAATRAVASARLGARTALVSEIGGDDFGTIVRAHLEREEHLDLGWVRETPSTPVSVALTSASDRAFLTYDRGRVAPSFEAPDLPPARFIHLGLAEGIPAVARTARTAGSVLVAGVGWDDSGAWPTEHLDALAGIDVFCPNADEAVAYTRAGSLLEAIALLAQRVPTLIVTDGARGAWIAGSAVGDPVLVPGFPSTPADPTGAGDVFIAAAIVELARGEALADATVFANAAASLAVAAYGGASSAPTRAQVRAHISRTADTQETTS